MKLLLITPPNSSQERYGKLLSIRTLYFLPDLAYIIAYRKAKRHEFKVVDSEEGNYNFEDINEIKEKYSVGNIQFFDKIFTINKKRIIELYNKMIEEKLDLGGTEIVGFNTKKT